MSLAHFYDCFYLGLWSLCTISTGAIYLRFRPNIKLFNMYVQAIDVKELVVNKELSARSYRLIRKTGVQALQYSATMLFMCWFNFVLTHDHANVLWWVLFIVMDAVVVTLFVIVGVFLYTQIKDFIDTSKTILRLNEDYLYLEHEAATLGTCS